MSPLGAEPAFGLATARYAAVFVSRCLLVAQSCAPDSRSGVAVRNASPASAPKTKLPRWRRPSRDSKAPNRAPREFGREGRAVSVDPSAGYVLSPRYVEGLRLRRSSGAGCRGASLAAGRMHRPLLVLRVAYISPLWRGRGARPRSDRCLERLPLPNGWRRRTSRSLGSSQEAVMIGFPATRIFSGISGRLNPGARTRETLCISPVPAWMVREFHSERSSILFFCRKGPWTTTAGPPHPDRANRALLHGHCQQKVRLPPLMEFRVDGRHQAHFRSLPVGADRIELRCPAWRGALRLTAPENERRLVAQDGGAVAAAAVRPKEAAPLPDTPILVADGHLPAGIRSRNRQNPAREARMLPRPFWPTKW